MNRRLIYIILLHFTVCKFIVLGDVLVVNQYNPFLSAGINDIIVGGNTISVPLGKLVLIRKMNKYGAVKFTKHWTTKNVFSKNWQNVHATYESYYQGDSTGNFSKKNVKIKEGKLAYLPFPGFPPHPLILGNPYVHCGTFKLMWDGTDTIDLLYFCESYEKIDYNLELAPTKWTQINEVNVFDPRLKWYKYDDYRKDIIIPIDKLWEEHKQESAKPKKSK